MRLKHLYMFIAPTIGNIGYIVQYQQLNRQQKRQHIGNGSATFWRRELAGKGQPLIQPAGKLGLALCQRRGGNATRSQSGRDPSKGGTKKEAQRCNKCNTFPSN